MTFAEKFEACAGMSIAQAQQKADGARITGDRIVDLSLGEQRAVLGWALEQNRQYAEEILGLKMAAILHEIEAMRSGAGRVRGAMRALLGC